VSKIELTETQFERTDRDKITCKTHLELLNYDFIHIFEILVKFPIQQLQKHLKIWYSQEDKRCQSLNCQKHALKDSQGQNCL